MRLAHPREISMGQTVYVDHDLVGVRLDGSTRKLVLAWGDPVEVLGRENGFLSSRTAEGRG
jgi:hypothetical protein